MRRGKRYFALLMISVLMAMMLSGNTKVQAEENKEESSSCFYYNALDWNVSSHFMQSNDNGRIWAMLFWLCNEDIDPNPQVSDINLEDYPGWSVAYCCDLDVGIESQAPLNSYKRVNLEDSTYFDEQTAKLIRGVFQHGYWYDWTEEELATAQASANAWLTAQNMEGQITELTYAQALSATQGAVWSLSNNTAIRYSETDAGIYDRYDLGKTTFDVSKVLPTEEQNENTESNINLFLQYLISQEGKEPEKILFTDNHFVENEEIVVSGSEKTQNVSVRFQLAGDIGENDDLKLYVKLGDRDVEGYPLTGDEAMEMDADGYYKVEFSDVTAEEAEKGISMKILGFQCVDSVYFYEALPVDGETQRTTTQNLVGKASGETAVSASAAFEVEWTETTPEEPEEPEKETEQPQESQEPESETQEPQEVQESTETVTTPETGDNTNAMPFLMMAGAAFLTIAVVVIRMRKSN